MDRSECQRVVEREMPRLAALFGLGHWTIAVEYGPRDDEATADCARNLSYDRATVGFDPERIADEAELLATIRHELFHVVHGAFDLFYNVASAGLKGDRLKVADRAWHFAAEQTVIALERMYQGLAAASAPPPKAGRTKKRGR